ncbi:MAG: DNA repair protein RecN [Desulfobacteraceae bacterium]|nr:DNA repair protein RecN [Desulfobacteraceae bacterium]
MLQELSIRNFAIIDDLRIRFSTGLSILSGETGAGKSIIINAVNLILGSRANAKLIRTGEKNAELEALFSISPGSSTARVMAENGYDPVDGLLIRRIISHQDRHRIYINGRLATIQVLSQISENLASISGQHAHQGLLKEDQHLLIIDQYGALLNQRERVSRCYHDIQSLVQKLDKLVSRQQRQQEHIELLSFQKNEIDDATIEPEEDKALEVERLRLKNAETLFQSVSECLNLLYNAEGSVFENLGEIAKTLEKNGLLDPLLAPKATAVEDTGYQIEDVAEYLRSYVANLEIDDTRLDVLDERLNVINRIKRKYGGSLDAVTTKYAEIEQELSEVENVGVGIKDLKKRLETLHAELKQQAAVLSGDRARAGIKLGKKVERELASLKMSQSQFSVALRPIEADSATPEYLRVNGHAATNSGMDMATFMIAPNVGEAMKPLAAIASGGELSRVVLALKAILAETDAVGTIVFDEVDAGIGGEVAEVVGIKLSELAAHHQVICITHLPQIAKFGDQHFKISKSVSKGRTTTTICAVDAKERVLEIARMLGGVNITEATLSHARELLKS